MSFKYCFCKSEDGENTICCSGVEDEHEAHVCPGNGWYHFKCLKISAKFANNCIEFYYCSACSKRTGKSTTYYPDFLASGKKSQLDSSRIENMDTNEEVDNYQNENEKENEVPENEEVSEGLEKEHEAAEEEEKDEEADEDESEDESEDGNEDESEDEDEDEEVFDIKDLLSYGEDDNTGERMWLVSWTGYNSAKHDTWEFESNLQNCIGLVNDKCRELKLPLSKYPVLAGADIRQKGVRHNLSNWVTAHQVSAIIFKFRRTSFYRSPLKIHVLTDSYRPSEDSLLIYLFESHFYC